MPSPMEIRECGVREHECSHELMRILMPYDVLRMTYMFDSAYSQVVRMNSVLADFYERADDTWLKKWALNFIKTTCEFDFSFLFGFHLPKNRISFKSESCWQFAFFQYFFLFAIKHSRLQFQYIAILYQLLRTQRSSAILVYSNVRLERRTLSCELIEYRLWSC